MKLWHVRTGQLVTSDGITLHYAEHLIPHPVGSVVLVHGLGEHSGRYAHVIEVFNRSGLNVVQFDHRGHGHSQGQRGHIESYDRFLDDLEQVLDHALSSQRHQKIVLYGHSMGGGIVANWMLRRFNDHWEDHLLGVVLSAPWFRLTNSPSWVKKTVIHRLSQVFPTLDIPTRLRVGDLCREEEAIRRFQADSIRHDRITVNTAWHCFQAGRWALENASRFPLPLLAIHGTADCVTSSQATAEFCAQIPGARYVPLENLIHEPHNDQNWREVVYHVTDWIVERYQFAYAA